MSRLPLIAGSGAALTLAFPLAIAALVVFTAGSGIWVALHLCARLGATAASLPALLAIAVATSVLGLAIWHGARQARLSRRAVGIAHAHAVPSPLWVTSLAARLHIRRLVVSDLPGNVAYCAGLWRPVVVVSRNLIEHLAPDPLAAVLAHERARPCA